jgi:hypothetical protein
MTAHLVHAVLIGAAAVAFLVVLAVQVRRHGRPTFSWRLRA